MTTMRGGKYQSRSHAILNSPIIRSHLTPFISTAFTAAPIIIDRQTMDEGEEEGGGELIPTQPLATASTLKAGAFQIRTTTTTTTTQNERKRRRTSSVDDDDEAVVVVEVETRYTADNLPPELTKYWYQRHRLFSLYDEGCRMDLEGWYSVTPELIAAQIAERCRSNVIVDAFCGVGGNAIQFAFTCEKVIAIDISPTRLACARHNAALYGVADRITFIEADFLTWSRHYVQRMEGGLVQEEDVVDVVFLSPPWGGIGYKSIAASSSSTALDASSSAVQQCLSFPLSALGPVPGDELFQLARRMTRNVAFYLPKNVDVDQVAALPFTLLECDVAGGVGGDDGGDAAGDDGGTVEIEEAWMGNKLKAVTAYFGDLGRKGIH